MSKKLIRVDVKEVWTQPTYVLADSLEDAIKRVESGEGVQEPDGLEYSFTLDSDRGWSAEEIQDPSDVAFWTEIIEEADDD